MKAKRRRDGLPTRRGAWPRACCRRFATLEFSKAQTTNESPRHRYLFPPFQIGKTSARWSADTTRRVAQGLLSTLRDFGILEGANNKRIAPPSLPVSAFSDRQNVGAMVCRHDAARGPGPAVDASRLWNSRRRKQQTNRPAIVTCFRLFRSAKRRRDGLPTRRGAWPRACCRRFATLEFSKAQTTNESPRHRYLFPPF